MKDSAVSENKQGGGSVLKKEGIARPAKYGEDARISPLAGIIQRSGCRSKGCSHSLSSLARGIAGAPGTQRKTIGNLLQKSLGNRFVQGLAAQRLQSAKEMTASEPNNTIQAKTEAQSNKTGMPDNLKSSIESLSGLDLSDIRVHYNSADPARVNALAYTQGHEIYVAPGQERHLPHEAWHAVQQAQGRVKPTMQLMCGVSINDDQGLEHEADEIGERANNIHTQREIQSHEANRHNFMPTSGVLADTIVQRRAPPDDLPNLSLSHQDENLFDSRLETGKLFTRNIRTNDNLYSTVISEYINAVRPVGTAAANFGGYTDRLMVNPSPMLGYLWPPVPAGGPFDLALANQMGMSPAGISFVRGKTKEEAITWLTAASTQPQMNLNSDNFNWVDPFLVKLIFTSKQVRQRPWEITTQFADSGTGYITRIKNGEKDLTGTIKTQADFIALGNNPAVNKDEYVYSSTHDPNAQLFSEKISNISGYRAGSTRGENELGLDAITWLAAEGARFEPVRKMGKYSKPQTQFYVKPDPHGWAGARSCTLAWLMTNWGGHFNRAYNIPAATVAAIVALNGAAINHAPAGRRFNLTKDRVEE